MRHNQYSKIIIFVLVFAFIFNGLSLKAFGFELPSPPTGDKKIVDLEKINKILPPVIVNFINSLGKIGNNLLKGSKVEEAIESPESTETGKWLGYLTTAWEWLKTKFNDILGVDLLTVVKKVVSVIVWITEKAILIFKNIIQ